MSRSVRIAVVGSGYVGLVAAACFAEIGHDVVCVDNDERKVESLRAGICPIHEEHLPAMLKRYGNTKIRFTTDLSEATRSSEVIFIAVGTPQSETGDADLSYVEAVAAEIGRAVDRYTILVEKSTVPVYTNEWIRKTMERNGVDASHFDVASNPEFLREGTAVEDFLHPDRIVVGANSDQASKLLAEIYEPLTSGEYFKRSDAIAGFCTPTEPPPLLLTSTKSAEIIKHASNAFLAMKISFINAVSSMCEAADADVEQVSRGMGLDRRIGMQFLRPGIGYGGSCFPKDVAAFRAVAEQLGLGFDLLAEVEKINVQQQQRFLSKVRSALWTLRGKKIGVLGLAFKGGTDDIRDSPAIAHIKMLIDEGCKVVAFDPAGMDRSREVLPPSDAIRYVNDAYEVAEGADALVVLTDWKEFKDLDIERLGSAMKYRIMVDGRNLFDPQTMSEKGFNYLSVGRPAVHPERRKKDAAVLAAAGKGA